MLSPKVYAAEKRLLPGSWAILRHIESPGGPKLKAYRDMGSWGKWTIGYGHTETVKKGMVITQNEANQLLCEDLKHCYSAYEKHVKVDLPSKSADAIILWIFNLGETNLRKSTLLKKLNEADFYRAEAELQRWVFVGRKRTRGLYARRGMERALFIEGLAEAGLW